MFQIKSEEIEVTPKMIAAGRRAFRSMGFFPDKITALMVAQQLYRAMEKARRKGMVKVSWSEPHDDASP